MLNGMKKQSKATLLWKIVNGLNHDIHHIFLFAFHILNM